jgi:CO/xanthine dehydrogenase FAD-binding subunit
VRSFRYLRPSNLQEVIGFLEEHGAGARLLAGGTDLSVELHYGQSLPRAVIDLKRANDLSPIITEEDGWLAISATVPLTDVEGNKTVRRCFPALAEAAAVVGSIQIRNRATLVGNVCNASPAADMVPVLAVYGAVVKIIGRGGERSLPLVDFIQGNRRTALVAGELATALCIPFPSKPFGSAFARVTRRYGVDLAAVNLCCGIDGSGMTTLAFGAVSPRPLVVQDRDGVLADPSAAADIKSVVLDALISKATPITDVRASAEYRLAMLKVLALRAQRRAAERLAKGK